jgi:hypothetical protein
MVWNVSGRRPDTLIFLRICFATMTDPNALLCETFALTSLRRFTFWLARSGGGILDFTAK